MSSVTLSWAADPASDNVIAYQVWGANGTSTAFGSCSKLATVNALTWTESGLPNAQTRTYYIVAVNAAGSSAPQGPINITTATSATSIIIEDEGSTLTSAPTSINFAGAGVTATVSGADVTVTIPGGGGGGGGSAPTVVQTATFIGNSVSITMGSAPTAGNVLIAAISHWNNNASPGTGWQQLLTNNGSAVDGWFLAWKWAAAGESVTQTPVSVGTSGNNIVIWEVSGCNFVFPFQNALESTGTTKSLTFATSVANSLLLGMVAAIGSNLAPTITNATNTGNTTGTRGSGTPDSVTTFSASPTVNVSFSPTATYGSSVTSLMIAVLLLPG